MNIRAERPDDVESISEVNRQAFQQDDESEMVARIRAGDHFVPELSLVAEENGHIFGHIMFSQAKIIGRDAYDTLVLAPLAVLPAFQNRGVGAKLIVGGLKNARHHGCDSVIVVGDPRYYPRFGFQKASKWGIRCPFEAPGEAVMATELNPGALTGRPGVVQFPDEFGIE